MVLLVILGLLKFVKNSPIKPVLRSVATRSLHSPKGLYRRILDEFQEAQDDTYVGTLDGLYQHTLIAAGMRLRPVEATFFGRILGTNPPKIWGFQGV